MKIKTSIRDRKGERDTMQPEYDFPRLFEV